MTDKKLTSDEKYAIAQDLFLETDKTQKEIAQIVHVTEKTLTKWKNEGEWDMLKMHQPLQLVKSLRTSIRGLMN